MPSPDLSKFPFSYEKAHSESVWQGDSQESARDPNQIPHPHDVVTALMVVGYEASCGRAALPSSVMADFGSVINVYNLGRTLKRPDDAKEAFFTEAEAYPGQWETLETIFELMEDVHQRGLELRPVVAEISVRSAQLVQLQFGVGARYPDLDNGQLCTQVWQEALQAEELPFNQT
jgi:hypothetical protein